MKDFLFFETMLTPLLIQILFWLVVIACVLTGIMLIVRQEAEGDLERGLALIVLGPVVARICSEILIVVFRIHDDLRSIEQNTRS
jgi:hypothetical protein